MVVLTDLRQEPPCTGRLTLQTAAIAPDSTVIRCLDWDRDRFDIEFELQNGTTYNSFLIRGEKTALIDTSHSKFRTLYLEELRSLVDLAQIDYLIVNHTEPDHSGLISDLLDLAPQITVVGSKVAIQFLQNQIHRPFATRTVKSGDRLDLGGGHDLEFVSAPNLHWPDTMLTYDSGTQVLYTCDVFGLHYCDDTLYDETPSLLEADFRLYYDCLMGPNARSVLAALKRIEPLTVDQIATGHGPLLRHHLTQWREHYRSWSQAQAQAEPFVALFYVGEYGHSDRIVHSLGQGLLKTGTAVELVDLLNTDVHAVRELTMTAAGLVLGMPPQTAPDLEPILSTILAAAHPKQSIGLFETGGGQDEPIFPLRNRFQDLGLKTAFEPILIKSAPTEATDKLCEEAGTDLGQWVNRDGPLSHRSQKPNSALNVGLDQALGRLSTGLYIVTAKKGAVSSAMLASWVIQASAQPPGIAVAVSKDRAIESLLHGGDTFVLNVLEEGHYQHLMKHFLKRFPPGGDRFEGIATYAAENGSPILAEALAYLECTATHRLEAGDHWVIYATARVGRVAKPDGLTAVHHRKASNHY
ncbi:diflavin flavoprotein [Nodosilinea sp. LEGE 06152]|uniref:diflavin flavoprotein n=1 Tax=Nodosilinea sp. LEGE 06152 TaxID=2777966 RepID=UPI00187FA9AA|nr:diflavin flavoprotein [Nodosilinea sp. LEGE 06152]MBE9156595.1 diflavin flavoprotein [Nodosilinea sp. LEGE 06152]